MSIMWFDIMKSDGGGGAGTRLPDGGRWTDARLLASSPWSSRAGFAGYCPSLITSLQEELLIRPGVRAPVRVLLTASAKGSQATNPFQFSGGKLKNFLLNEKFFCGNVLRQNRCRFDFRFLIRQCWDARKIGLVVCYRDVFHWIELYSY